jgi:uncharacterized protein YndB with AHSA1/START domain
VEAAFFLLLAIGHIGVFDILYFHWHRCGLQRRAECQTEVFWHTLRHAVYAAQFVAIANFRFHGAALFVLGFVYVADFVVAWADVWSETDSRKPQGGLPRLEYFMHIVLSVLVGCYLVTVWTAAWPDRLLPAEIVYEPPAVPWALRFYMNGMAAAALVVFAHDLRRWWRVRRHGPAAAANKIVVEVLVPAPVDEVWRRTQDPAEHVRWDIRFTDIRYLEEHDARGFRKLRYRTRIALGVEVEGVGAYLHSEPPHHSTFEFDSDDWKSLIQKGRGIWMYEARPEGTFFKTVYDYEIRHGLVGHVLDALFFRRMLQLATEYGFETLRRWCAGDAQAPARRTRARFLGYYLLRQLGWRPRAPAALSWLGSGTAVERLDPLAYRVP